jgi:3-oxoacyl-[acyl-carrier protein] reductase
MQVVVNSHFYLIRDLYNIIAPNSRIVFIGSMMGVLPHGTSLPYGVSKSAVHALAKNLVKDFVGTGTTLIQKPTAGASPRHPRSYQQLTFA